MRTGCKDLSIRSYELQIMRIKLSEGEKEKKLEERVIRNLEAGKTIDSSKMAASLGIDHANVVAVFNKLVGMVAEKVV